MPHEDNMYNVCGTNVIPQCVGGLKCWVFKFPDYNIVNNNVLPLLPLL